MYPLGKEPPQVAGVFVRTPSQAKAGLVPQPTASVPYDPCMKLTPCLFVPVSTSRGSSNNPKQWPTPSSHRVRTQKTSASSQSRRSSCPNRRTTRIPTRSWPSTMVRAPAPPPSRFKARIALRAVREGPGPRRERKNAEHFRIQVPAPTKRSWLL